MSVNFFRRLFGQRGDSKQWAEAPAVHQPADGDIKPGMTRQQVEALLGSPTRATDMAQALSKLGGIAGDVSKLNMGLSACSWKQRDGEWIVHFDNGLVQKATFHKT